MNRAELKKRAKENLGGGIFKNEWLWGLLVLVIFTAISGAAGSIIPGIGALIVLGPLTAGMLGYFQKLSRKQNPEIGNLFDGFTKDFGGNFVLGLLKEIFIALWSLLFIIPGIVKSYSYAMAYYIKNDNEGMNWKDALDASKKMMDGHKMELFILDLSFIGWYFVGALCLGVGTLWVLPYHEATKAEFYEALK